jgi:hypothetical protein
MATPQQVHWTIEADYLQACNCDYGCPCEFDAPPTQGFCEGIGVWRINRGRYGDVALDGLGLGIALHFPGPLHEGHGTLVVLVDERANAPQREALLTIASGQAGGMPFALFGGLVSNPLEPRFVPFQFDIKGKDSRATLGDAVSVALEPIKNPVTGDPEGIRIERDTPIMFQSAEVVSARECRASVGELTFSWPNKGGFVTQVVYGN